MKNKRNTVSNIFIICMIIIAVIFYRKYDYNFYTKGVTEKGRTSFSRDNSVKYSKTRSYKIENIESNDAMFYRKITVNPNSPYKVSCMVKTQNVIGEDENTLAGAQICLNGTEEHSEVLQGDNDWTKLEFLFDSKNNNTVEIGFRLGGNMQNASGIAWFSDFTIEEGAKDDSNVWNFGCFVIDNIEAEIDGTKETYEVSTVEKSMVIQDMSKLQSTIQSFSNGQICIEYDIIEIKEPLTTLTYDEENGYYITEKDVRSLINSYVQKGEYDYIFVCTNLPLESELLNSTTICEWIGLGNMLYDGKGFSNIRIMTQRYTYSGIESFSEEVYLHEFLHTLERNSQEYGYTIPALHDYEEYGYTKDKNTGLKKWYQDYMNRNILSSDGQYLGIPQEIYLSKPAQESDFIYSNQLDELDEPKGIVENIESIIYKVKRLFQADNTEFNTTYKGVAE